MYGKARQLTQVLGCTNFFQTVRPRVSSKQCKALKGASIQLGMSIPMMYLI